MTDQPKTFLFDIGNTLISLDYEAALEEICRYATVDRDRLVQLMEWSGGYHDLERGAVDFAQFHDFMRSRAGYRGGIERLRKAWCMILSTPVEGIEELLERIRQRYTVAFLSNSNEVHAEFIQRRYRILFRKADAIIYSHVHRLLKPDSAIYLLACETVGVEPRQVVFVDDLYENVQAARNLGMRAYQFSGALDLGRELEMDGLLEAPEEGNGD